MNNLWLLQPIKEWLPIKIALLQITRLVRNEVPRGPVGKFPSSSCLSRTFVTTRPYPTRRSIR